MSHKKTSLATNKRTTPVPLETVAYSRAATHLVVQNLKQETMMPMDDDSVGVSYLHFWYSFSAGGLEETRPGNLAGADLDQMTGKELLDWHVNALEEEQPTHHHHVLPTCDGCGNTLEPGTCDTKTRIRSLANGWERKRQPKRAKLQAQDNKEVVDDDYPPDLWKMASASSRNQLKNYLVVGCRLCGQQTNIPGLPRKEKDKSTDRDKRSPGDPGNNRTLAASSSSYVVPRDPRPRSNAEAAAAELPTRDFIPLLDSMAKNKKKRKRSPKPKSTQLTDFLNTLND